MMRALIVGAGAVGQVFGHHLAKAGAEVSFLVKPKYVAECERGFMLYKLPRTEGERFAAAKIVSEADATYDQVYITISSPALRSGTWLADLARATGDATIVVLQPGIDDRAFVGERIAESRIVDSTINFLAYHAPLPNETRFAAPGVAYWFFPGKAPFSSSSAGERVAEVVRALAAGGLPAKRAKDVPNKAPFPGAVLSAFIAALEASGWSFTAMRERGLAKLGARAAREAIAVVAHERGVKAPLGPRLLARPFGFRVFMRIAPRVAPVDLETYLRVHFTKVSDQMHEGFAKYAELGRGASLPVDALDELRKRLPG
jgi:2-dehydropantoate 2-reductase